MADRRRAAKAPAPPPDLGRAMEIAAGFLGTRPRTRWELERRLRRAGAPDEVVDAACRRLAELGYLDDAAFARWWGDQRDRHSPRGRRMIEAELRQRGVPRDVIESHRGEHAEPERSPEDQGLPGSEPERAATALARHLRGRPLPSDRKAVQRIGTYLMRRGFDAETVRATIRAAGTDFEDEAEYIGRMVSGRATTPDEYLAGLPDDRRTAVAALRDTINTNLPDGFEEGIFHGMIAWYVPLERFGNTYNGEPLGLAGVASQKNYISLYLLSVYGDRETEAWFKERYARSGKKLNMGKSCVRFRRLEDIPFDVVGETIARVDLDAFLAHYEETRGSYRKARGAD